MPAMASSTKEVPPKKGGSALKVVSKSRRKRNLFPGAPGGGSWSAHLLKAQQTSAKSRQDDAEGSVAHPFNMEAVAAFKNQNTDHSACIETKRSSTVGLGLVNESAEKTLNELCDISWQDLIDDITEDWWNVGNGYMEVVREQDSGPIVGLHHVPACYVNVVVERDKDRHFEVHPAGTNTAKFARFGDLAEFKERNEHHDDDDIGEIIHFRRSTAFSRYYGFPDWISAVAAVEVVHQILQYNFDFFLNHGVPEILLMFTGGELSEKDWKAVEDLLGSGVGGGNRHKSAAINPEQANIEIAVEKLGTEMKDGSFQGLMDGLSRCIVTAHRVPPVLAGILVPGKLGTSNELEQAMKVFQAMVIGPAQKSIRTTLECTLGDAAFGIPGLGGNAFEFKKITDEIEFEKEQEGIIDPRGAKGTVPPEDEAEAALRDELRKSLQAPDAMGKAAMGIFSMLLKMAKEAA